jgi:LEA14-like dessication related protein
MALENAKLQSYISEMISATEKGTIKWNKVNPTTNSFAKNTSTGAVTITIQRASNPKGEFVYLFQMYNSSSAQIMVKFDSSDGKELHDLLAKLYEAIDQSYVNKIYSVFDELLK